MTIITKDHHAVGNSGILHSSPGKHHAGAHSGRTHAHNYKN